MSSFYPDRLYNYDAEDEDGNTVIGHTDRGEEVRISRRAAESDLVVYVNINLVAMNGGHKSVHTGISPYSSIRHHHNAETLRNTRSLMDPPNSAMHGSINRMGEILDSASKGLPHRDHPEQRHLPARLRLHGQARARVERRHEGQLSRQPQGNPGHAQEGGAQGLPVHRAPRRG
jgi:hypothetical protein